MKRKMKYYSISRGKNAAWEETSQNEWAVFVRAGKLACISEIAGWFKTLGGNSWVQICTGRSFRKNRLPGEWETRVWDHFEFDLVNPSYCRGSLAEIKAMHARGLSRARQWIRNYVERNRHYSENIFSASDPSHLAKSPDFEVDYFEEYWGNDLESNPYLQEGPYLDQSAADDGE